MLKSTNNKSPEEEQAADTGVKRRSHIREYVQTKIIASQYPGGCAPKLQAIGCFALRPPVILPESSKRPGC